MNAKQIDEIKPQGSIYLLRNLVNGKGYVGQHRTLNAKRRWLRHFTENEMAKNRPLHRAIRKYGASAFQRKVLWIGPLSKLSEMEVFFIAELGTFIDSGGGYNLTTGGEEGERSEQTRARISVAVNRPENLLKLREFNRARYQNPLERARTGEAVRLSFENPELRAKRSANIKSRYENPEERKKLSDAQHRRYQDPAERDRSKNRANQQWDKLDKEERTKLALRIWETRRANALKKSA